MPRKSRENYPPDADLIIVRDFSRDEIRFDVDVMVRIEGRDREDVAALIQNALKLGDKELAYGILYKKAKKLLDEKGPAHGTIQAAFGLIKRNDAVARKALRRAGGK